MPFSLAKSARREWGGPLTVALVACAAILGEIDPGGDYPSLAAGPGMTVDESLNVEHGVRTAVAIPTLIRGELSLVETFGEKEDSPQRIPALNYYLPDYPPLGRLWIGVFHNTAVELAPPADHPAPFVVAAARTGSAVAFGLTVLLVGWAAARWYGPVAGWVASIALVLMPRVFGHAHLASLETITGLAYAAAVISIGAFWSGKRPPSWKAVFFTGFLFGLVLLTKIQAVMLPIPIAAWAFYRHRFKAVLPILVWGITGTVILFAGWPWLWLDPVDHILKYVAGATDRVTIKVWYLGQSAADREVARHYAAVMFLTTVPAASQILGIVGLFVRRLAGNGEANPDSDRAREGLLAVCILFPLLLFAVPNVTVYDGARLFLVVFPLWAILIGRGGAIAIDRLSRRYSRRAAVAVCTVVFAIQCAALVAIRPYYLSYYNAFVGGLWGAEKLGFEPTYWSDSLSRDFLREVSQHVPANATVDVSPVLHRLQLTGMLENSPDLRKRGIKLRGYDDSKHGPAEYLIVFRRRADLSSEIDPPTNATPLVEVRRQGVLLAVLYRMGESREARDESRESRVQRPESRVEG